MSHVNNLAISVKPLFLCLSVLTLSNINSMLTAIGLIVSLSYGVRKWYILESELKKVKNEKKIISKETD